MRQSAHRTARQAEPTSTIAAVGARSAEFDAVFVESDITLSSVAPGQIVSVSGTIRNDVSLGAAATLTEPSGQALSVFGDIVGPASGGATVLVAAAGTLYLAGAVGSDVAIAFGGSAGTLQLSSLYVTQVVARIGGFALGDVVDLVSGTLTDATLAASGPGQILTLADEGNVVATLTLSDTAAGGDAAFAIPDPVDGTRVVLAPALPATGGAVSPGTPGGQQFVWKGGLAGQWSSAAAWQTTSGVAATIAPGQHDSAAIAGPQSSVLVVAGNAAAATLATQGLVALTGNFSVAALVAGSATSDALILAAGAQVVATTLTVAAGLLQVAALGAVLEATSPVVAAGGTLWVADGGSAALAGLVLTGGVVRLGSTGAITVGAAATAAGALAIGAAGSVSGSGTIEGAIGNAGTIAATGTLQIYSSVNGSGSLAIGAAAELYLPDGAASGQQVAFQGSGGTLELFGSASACSATITGFGVGDVIDIASDTVSQAGWTAGASGTAGTLDFGASGTLSVTLAPGLTPATASFSLTADALGGTAIEVLPCFCAGTRLSRPGGTVAVEDVRVGDRLLTRSGAARRVRWIGWRTYDAAQLHREPQLRPVRLAPHALGAGAPSHPVLLSPQHGIALSTPQGLRLVPAVALTDGRAVRRSNGLGGVAYFHVELDEHDLLIAAGLVVESYQPQGPEDRSLFAHSAGGPVPPSPAAAPRLEGGAALEDLRLALGLRRLVHRPQRQPWRGHIDRVEQLASTVVVEGWATARNLREPLWIAVTAGTQACVVTVANRWRPDLDHAGLPAGVPDFVPSCQELPGAARWSCGPAWRPRCQRLRAAARACGRVIGAVRRSP